MVAPLAALSTYAEEELAGELAGWAAAVLIRWVKIWAYLHIMEGEFGMKVHLWAQRVN